MPSPRTRTLAFQALCAYAAPLAKGRRVVLFADATLGLGERLVALGARVVHVYDCDAERVARASRGAPRGVVVRPLPEGEIDVREGAFDLALAPDLVAFGAVPDMVKRVRRMVGPDGAALMAADAGAVDYYELYDSAALEFAKVTMIGEVPFTGVTLAELGDGSDEPEVSVDTQLIETAAPPQRFVVLASQRKVSLDAYALIQLPEQGAEHGATSEGDPHAIDARGGSSDALERVQVALAEAELRARVAEGRLDEERVAAKKLAATRLEESIAEVRAELKAAEGRAGDSHVRAERLSHDLRKLEEELVRQRERGFKLVRELEDEKKLRQKAELELGMVRKNPELASARERIGLVEEALRASEEASLLLQVRLSEVEADLTSRTDERERLRVAFDELQLQAEARLSALLQNVAAAEARARSFEEELAQHEAAHASELSQVEAILREGGTRIHALEKELLRREVLVHDLLQSVDELREQQTAPHAGQTSQADVAALREALELARAQLQKARDEVDWARERRNEHEVVAAGLREALGQASIELQALRMQLDALALDVARREGNLQSATWRISELEGALERLGGTSDASPNTSSASQAVAPSGESNAVELEAQLAQALSEIDVLKQALAQEHAALKRAESANGERAGDLESPPARGSR